MFLLHTTVIVVVFFFSREIARHSGNLSSASFILANAVVLGVFPQRRFSTAFQVGKNHPLQCLCRRVCKNKVTKIHRLPPVRETRSSLPRPPSQCYSGAQWRPAGFVPQLFVFDVDAARPDHGTSFATNVAGVNSSKDNLCAVWVYPQVQEPATLSKVNTHLVLVLQKLISSQTFRRNVAERAHPY